MSTGSTSRPLPRKLHLVLNAAGPSGLPTPSNAPLSAPLSLNSKELDFAVSKPNPRRQSSISYNTVSKARSSGHGLERSNSLRSKVVLCSEGTHGDEVGATKIPEVREIEPVTLAEKHADLLRFIAQKEAKCLELRTQLAQHEADLLLLKRKWERIVSKGLPSAALSETPTNVGSEMLGGIREGVQSRLERVFAALEPSPAGPSSTSQSSAQQLRSGRHSQPIVKEASTSSRKRASISTTSSGSTYDRSSLPGSQSSASSLFDDLLSPGHRSPPSSIEGNTAYSSPETEEASKATQSPQAAGTPSPENSFAEMVTGRATPEDDLSSKQQISRPTSTNLSHSPSPSLASVASESLTPLSRQMTNWVPPGLNKKWEEFKGNETLSKQSKRASTLLNDVLAVLAPPIPPPPKTTSSTIPKRNIGQIQSPSHYNLDSSFFDYTISGTAPARVSPSPSPSLLDEKDEWNLGEVLQPQVKVPVAPKQVDQNNHEDNEEEDWNW